MVWGCSGIPWAQHVAFLNPSVREIRQALPMEFQAGPCCSPTWWAMSYRYCTVARSRAGPYFLKELIGRKDSDPDVLVSYANYPYWVSLTLLISHALTFTCIEKRISAATFRLHNLAEINLSAERVWCWFDPRRAEARRDSSQKLSSSFEMGAAGTVVFRTDEWFTGGFAIQDWVLA